MEKLEEIFITNDKKYAPFLLAASFNRLIKFQGSRFENGVVFWKFAPRDKAVKLIQRFNTKIGPHLPAKDIFEATSTFWEQVSLAKVGLKNREALYDR